MKSFVDKTIKRNLRVYKTARKIYDKIKFREIKSNEEYFRNRIKKIKSSLGKGLDLSVKPDKNIILITIDCFRSDHASYNNYNRKTTKFLDSLRGYKSTLVPSSPWTYPSVASFITGFYPHNHGAIMGGEGIKKFEVSDLKPLKENVLTLSEILALFGYQTYFNSSIDLALLSIKHRFQTEKLNSLVDAEVILNDLEKWIKKQKDNFFAYVHLKDPHEPLTPPKEFRDYFDRVKKLPNIERWEFKKPEEQKGKEFEEFKENKLLLYDNTLRYVDYSLEQFYKFLEKEGLLDSTVLLITADHGEEFWDHAELEAKHFYDVRGYTGIGHGHSVFNELIQVPLIISGPNIPNKIDDKLASNVDITPTLLHMLDIPNDIIFDGINIFEAPQKRILITENTIHGYEKKALIYDKYKFIYSEDDNITWMFNLKKDRIEQNPIIDKELSDIFRDKLSEVTKEKMMLRGI